MQTMVFVMAISLLLALATVLASIHWVRKANAPYCTFSSAALLAKQAFLERVRQHEFLPERSVRGIVLVLFDGKSQSFSVQSFSFDDFADLGFDVGAYGARAVRTAALRA